MMRRAPVVVALLLLAPVAGYLFLPGEDERISMLLRDGRNHEAETVLRRRVASGDKDPRIFASLAQVRDSAGDLTGAIELMKESVAIRPRDPSALEYLARLYSKADAPEEEIATLARLVSIEPDKRRVARLAGLYRLNGNFDDEFELLGQMRERHVALTASDLVRLGEYLAAKGDLAAAVSPLLEADALLPPDQDRGRVLLFETLIASGRYDEAVIRAVNWMEKWRKPWIAMRFVRSLPARAPEGAVVRLAGAVIRLYPDTTFYIAKTLAEHGHQTAASAILLNWALAEAKPTVEDIGGLVAVYRVIGDPSLLWRILPVVLKRKGVFEAQAYFLEALADQFGDGAIVSLHASIPQEVFRARPIFAARLALQTGDQRGALRYLMGLRLSELPSRDQRAWFDLLSEATSPQVALSILLDRRRRGELPADLLPKLAELAGRQGYPGEQMVILNELAHL